MAKYRVDCWNCADGYIDGDCTCGEDCCCCLEPDPPRCDVCRGKGFLVVSELTDDNCQDAIAIPDGRASLQPATPTAGDALPAWMRDFIKSGITQFKEHELREIVAVFCKLPGIAPKATGGDAVAGDDQSFVDMLWKWFEDRGCDLRSERGSGLTADEFRIMLDEHEIALLPDVAGDVQAATTQESDVVANAAAMVLNMGEAVDTMRAERDALRAAAARAPRPNCPNGLEHGNCLYPDCVPSCPGKLSLNAAQPSQDLKGFWHRTAVTLQEENKRLREAAKPSSDGQAEYWRSQYDALHAHIEKMRASMVSSTDRGGQ